jgi:arylsulfatase A-like enzyme
VRSRVADGIVVATIVGALAVAALRPPPRDPRAVRGDPPPPVVAPEAHDDPVEAARPAAPSDAPHVVLVIGCTVRRDQITPYGGPAQTTPYLASMAEQGALFMDALATSSWTRESVAGLLTGTPSASFGLPDARPSPSERMLVPEATTLAEILSASGWLTLGVTANPNLNAIYGMAQGFDRYRDAVRERGFATRNKIEGPEVVSAAKALLDARTDPERERPFYLQVVFVDAHTPRVVGTEERTPFADPTVPLLVQDYRATLRRMDDAVKALDAVVSAHAGDRDVLFVFTTDHGEGLSMPAHHRGGHGKTMYDTTVAMPWIVRGGSVPAGSRVEGLASGEDVLPTTLALAGVAVPDVPGRDWSAWVRGERKGRTDRSRAFALSMFHGGNVDGIWTADRQCQRDHGSVGDPAPPLLVGCVDRKSDPWFLAPFDDPALMAELEAWRVARLAEGARFAAQDAPLSADTQGQLEALGYLEPEQ